MPDYGFWISGNSSGGVYPHDQFGDIYFVLSDAFSLNSGSILVLVYYLAFAGLTIYGLTLAFNILPFGLLTFGFVILVLLLSGHI